MKQNLIRLLISFTTLNIAVPTGLAIFMTSCTKVEDPIKNDTATFTALTSQKITEISLVKNDPTIEIPWIASLSHEHGFWEILSVSNVPSLSDHTANETFINHLLDSLTAIKILDEKFAGPLDSFGLEPPRFAFQFKSKSGQSELRIGNTQKSPSRVFVTLDGKSVRLATGNFFYLLEKIENWKSLRELSWIKESPDDVDEIEIKCKGHPTFYAQRDGTQWSNAKHKPIAIPITKIDNLLEKLMTQHWEEIIDSPQKTEQLKSWILPQPTYEIKLSGRMQTPIVLRIKKGETALFGINSGRPPTVFQLNSSLLKVLDQII